MFLPKGLVDESIRHQWVTTLDILVSHTDSAQAGCNHRTKSPSSLSLPVPLVAGINKTFQLSQNPSGAPVPQWVKHRPADLEVLAFIPAWSGNFINSK